MAHINDVFPSKYLKASDLGEAQPIVTIDRVDFEDVGQGQKKERKAIVYFQGKSKGLVLNKTNANKIMEITGEGDTDAWGGHKLKIYATETTFAGDTVECIRIKSMTGKTKMAPMTPKPVEVKPTPAAVDTAAFVEDDDSIPF